MMFLFFEFFERISIVERITCAPKECPINLIFANGFFFLASKINRAKLRPFFFAIIRPVFNADIAVDLYCTPTMFES